MRFAEGRTSSLSTTRIKHTKHFFRSQSHLHAGRKWFAFKLKAHLKREEISGRIKRKESRSGSHFTRFVKHTRQRSKPHTRPQTQPSHSCRDLRSKLKPDGENHQRTSLNISFCSARLNQTREKLNTVNQSSVSQSLKHTQIIHWKKNILTL